MTAAVRINTNRARRNRRRVAGAVVTGSLLVAVCGTAIGVVHTAHHSRQLAHELAALEHEADRARIEYDRLLLEQGAWAGHGRIMQLADTRLDMEAPDPFTTVTVR